MRDAGNHFHNNRFVFGQMPALGKFFHIVAADKGNLRLRIFQNIGDFRPLQHIVDRAGDGSEFLRPEHRIVNFRGIQNHHGYDIAFFHAFFREIARNGVGAVVNLGVTDHLIVIIDKRSVGCLPHAGQKHFRDAVKFNFSPLEGGYLFQRHIGSGITSALINHPFSPYGFAFFSPGVD